MSSRRRKLPEGAEAKNPDIGGKADASGIPESLYGKIDAKEMGSRAAREAAPVRKAEVKASAPVAEWPSSKAKSKKITVVDDFLGLNYKPRTKETRQVFEYLTSLVHSLLGGDAPHDATLSAADEVLSVLKEVDVKDLDRKTHIESVLGGSVDTEIYQQMMNLARRITDYRVASEESPEQAAEDAGVAVVFAEDDDEEDEGEYAISETEEADLVPAFALIKEDRPARELDEEEQAAFLQY